jgi:hypothetical protein
MENIDENSGRCKNCNGELSEKDKRIGMPICAECIKKMVDIIKNNVSKNSLKKYSDDVDNFAKFISSSSKLMGLDYLVVVQTCFNVYMNTLRNLPKRELFLKEKILRDSKAFIEIELENVELEKNESNDNDDDDGKDESLKGLFDMLINRFDHVAKERHDIEKDIDHEENGKQGSDLEDDINDSGKDGYKADVKGSKRIRVD